MLTPLPALNINGGIGVGIWRRIDALISSRIWASRTTQSILEFTIACNGSTAVVVELVGSFVIGAVCPFCNVNGIPLGAIVDGEDDVVGGIAG
jgi:hypothetical protein